MLDLQAIENMTKELGEGWGYAHARRVIALVEQISGGVHYDHELLLYAAYLHDWGAYPTYRIPGVNHVVRSHQITAEEILPRTILSDGARLIVLEAIERHDYRDQTPIHSSEALLLREADGLDLLGIIGMAREFAWGPNNLKLVFERIQARVERLEHFFTLPVAKEVAAVRLAEARHLLEQLENESMGWL